jgi:hypothetical protein
MEEEEDMLFVAKLDLFTIDTTSLPIQLIEKFITKFEKHILKHILVRYCLNLEFVLRILQIFQWTF